MEEKLCRSPVQVVSGSRYSTVGLHGSGIFAVRAGFAVLYV